MDNMKHRRLQELDRSDFEIVKDEPDIRGWDVRNDAGLKIGEVEELIVDAQQQKVRYMVVDLDDKDLKLPGRKVLIPIGLAELHKEEDDVILPTVTVDQLSVLPAYDRDSLDDETEQKVCTALGRADERASTILQGAGTGSQAAHTVRAESAPTHNESATQTDNPVTQPASAGSHAADTTSSQRGDDTTGSSSGQQPVLGTAEYYGNFYQHAYFNNYNLYRKRQEQEGSSEQRHESDYERGLRLWELRSEGGVIPENTTTHSHGEREVSDEERMERIRSRRKLYEERRGTAHHDEHPDSGQQHRKGGTIIDQIKNEGMRDA